MSDCNDIIPVVCGDTFRLTFADCTEELLPQADCLVDEKVYLTEC